MPWSVAGFGVKAGPTHYYFSLDENIPIPVSGTLNLLEELVEEGFDPKDVRGVSHVDIFGVTENDNVIVAAPETAILAAFGLIGIVAFRRKKYNEQNYGELYLSKKQYTFQRNLFL